MSTRTFRRLEDFWRHEARVQCECSNCGHIGTLDAYNLYRWFALHNWNSAVEALPEHLRCRVCKRRPTAIKPSPSNPDPSDFFPRDEEGWKRLQRRLRG